VEISRREFLKLGLAGGLALSLPFGASACSGEGSTGTLLPSRARLPEAFKVPLPVPPVLRPVRTDAGVDYYEMTQRVGRAEILPGLETEIWGYEGIFPGPTIASRSGRRIVVRQTNDLPVPVSIHLHGGRTPPGSDGYPTDLIVPKKGDHTMGGHGSMNMGGSRHFKDYKYPQQQRAATLWYHDHRMDFTGPQVWRGLAGFHLIRDEEEDALPLPGGERDVPLMICDRSFDADGSFMYPSLDPSLRGEPTPHDHHRAGGALRRGHRLLEVQGRRRNHAREPHGPEKDLGGDALPRRPRRER
jgi:spore coat protein A